MKFHNLSHSVLTIAVSVFVSSVCSGDNWSVGPLKSSR